ncbi:MAG: hypothetical protein QOJ12_1853, partial [Thermoleophilales bacterium]|nr:hypothetical protein [Thermoleophilales bacterium]
MKRTLLLIAAVAVGLLAAVQPPADSAKPRAPKPFDFEMAAPRVQATAARGGREYVSPPLRTSKRFDVVGMRWRGAAEGAHLRVRARRDGGRWTHWAELAADTADGPDPGSSERVISASAPAWAGQSDWVQYRSDRPLPGATLHFVNTTGAKFQKPAAARAAEAQPAVVSRDAWGAKDCPPRAAPDYGQVKMAFVHHTVNLNDYSREEAPAIVLGICRYHRNSNGWNDIGYNFLVDKYGTLYEGRAGGMDQPVVGAQAQGFNSQSTGIANIGTFEDVPQSNEALDAMARLIRWKLPLSGAPTQGNVQVTSAGGPSNRFAAGTVVTMNRISGHRDGNETACPGSALYAQLPDLRNRVGNQQPVAGSPSSGAGGVTRYGTKLAASTPTAAIVFGQPAAIGGRLYAYGGNAVADVPVALQRQTTGGGFKTVVRGATDDTGNFSLSFQPSKRAVVRVLFAGDAAHRPSQSKAATLQVRPALTFAAPPSRVGLRGLVSVAGTIGPRKSSVRLVVERRSGRGKKGRIAYKRVPASGGRFTARMRLRGAGLYRMYLVFPGDPNNLPVAGKAFFVRAA